MILLIFVGIFVFWISVISASNDNTLISVKDVKISWWSSCYRPYYNVKLDLYGKYQNIIYSELQYNYTYNWWCSYSSSRLWGSKYVWNSCYLVDVTMSEDSYNVNYKCNSYFWITSWAANWAWSKTNFTWTWSFNLSKSNYDLCAYNKDFCKNICWWVIFPWETLMNYLARVNESKVNQKISSTNSVWDPVNLNTWEFTYNNVLMQHNSKWFPFEFQVNYKNKVSYNGNIWNNFDYNYNQYLVKQTNWNIYYYNWKLEVFEFVKNTTWFDYNDTINAELRIVDWKYNIVFSNSKTYTFNTNLKIESISDNFDNKFIFVYNSDWNLETITDSNNRNYTLTYNTNKKLESITDFEGNKVWFEYYGSGETDWSEYDLKTIRLINWDDDREISFTYTIADSYENSHNIVKLIDSEQNIYVENTYDDNDRITSQKYGNGTIYYNYTLNDDWTSITENEVTDRDWNNIIYTYDENGNTIKKVIKKSTWDVVYNYEYNENNYLSKEILPLWNWYTYTYDDNNNLTEKRLKQDVTQDDSSDDLVTSITYDSTFNKPTSITTTNWVKTVLEYNSKWSLTSQKVYDAESNLLTTESYEYNSNWELIKEIDPKWNETSFEYTNGNLTKVIKWTWTDAITTQYNYDTEWNIISITDWEWNTTSITYDEFNLLKSITTPENIVSEYTYNSLNKKTNEKIILSDDESVDTSFTYDILDNPTSITKDVDNLRQKTIVTAYDNNSNITEIKDWNNATIKFVYDEQWNITSKTIVNWTQNITTSYVYDENNRLTKQINPNNSEVDYTYNLFNQVTKITDSNGTYSSLSYDKAWNVTKREVYNSSNSLLQKETYTYDDLWRELETKVYDLENNKEITTSKEYDKNNNTTKTIDAKWYTTNYSYDQFDRLVESTDSLWNKITIKYNKNSKITKETITKIDWTSIATTYAYDDDNRLISETNNLNQTVSYTYNKLNQVISKTDKDWTITTYKYDYAWNILQETIWTKITNYEYDINWNNTKVTDANGNITTYEYDSLNRLVKQTYPDNNYTTYEYDISWNLYKRTDPNGTIVINTYDSLNRLTHREIQTWTDVEWVTSESYTYDALGRLVSATDSEWNDLSFNYDSLSRLTSETNSNDTINYIYDNNGNTTSINNINYTYDIANRLTSVKNWTKTVANYTYDSLNLLSQTLWNGVTTNYTYDTLNRLHSLGHSELDSESSNDTTYTYTYNTRWDITSDGKDSYTYDSLGRLTWVNYDKVNTPQYNWDKIERFYYDDQWNRTSQENYTLKDVTTQNCTDETVVEEVTLPNWKTKTVEKKQKVCSEAVTQTEKERNTINYTTNELNQYTKLQNLNKNWEVKKEFTYWYDNNGNLKKDDINQYFYDYKNRLIKVVQNEIVTLDESWAIVETIPEQEIVSYKYDVLWRRIEKKTQNKTINYIYAGQNAIKEIIKDNETNEIVETRQNIYSNNTDDILSTIITDNTDNTTKQIYYEKNHLGSITKIKDTNWWIIEQYIYDVFWKAYIKNWNSTNYKEFKKSSLWINRLYTWREYDYEIGLYYIRARYYSSELGKFISRDPIDISDDVNLYAYVRNNPIMYVDINGLKSKSLIINNKSLERINKLHPLIRDDVVMFIENVYNKLWIELYITDWLRTIEEQNLLYSQWRNWNSWNIVTKVKWWYSYHNYWLAFDISSLNEDWTWLNYNLDWDSIWDIWKEIWFEWWWDWDNFVDKPHFQKTYNYTTSELLKIINDWTVDSEWYALLK